jgi:excisionase family DNA binding protein
MSAMFLISDVAERLRCSERTVRRLANAGKMPAPVRVGGMIRWHADVVTKWIDAGCPVMKPTKLRR